MLTRTAQSHSVLLAVLCMLSAPLIAAGEDALATFGDTVPVLGQRQMERTDQDFVDGLALDLFSPVNRTLVVTNNTSPLPGNFVTGSSGEGFVNLSKYSWIVKFNESAQDLIAKIEVPYDPSALKEQGIDVSNTYVGTLAADGKSWMVSEAQRNVHISENKTRIIKMTSLDGEYMLLGRKSEDTTNIFVQYGQGATRTVNATEGDRFQEAEFVDGLRFKIKSAQSFPMNVDLANGVDKASLPENTISLNSFAWVVNSTNPAGNTLDVAMRFPYNEAILSSKAPGSTPKQLDVARRRLNPDPTEQFQVVGKQELAQSENRIKVSDLSQADGQYVILVRSNK
ncbi:putative paired amphipathic helix protein sin3a protein [Hirsutella rhossiliensis]|uniref:Paired amphipathic helix protein sin3a protein n=1 Tax=Hirsutella rhossiliensis TaxID=111463 RepID=A0A9P8N136_9HYPO|nr:putative paired amphipathic helix protein sin3a protein [Hirsutella rhossiliensis]KAH0964914.1 putative paired amphipathic helix protein sin3a protein [Hirsutella rhossiliensis]